MKCLWVLVVGPAWLGIGCGGDAFSASAEPGDAGSSAGTAAGVSNLSGAPNAGGSGPLALECSDAARNGTETDVDCGGACRPCATGQACRAEQDCDLARCVGGKCAAPSCSDGIENQGETDVDCGGETTCARCAQQKRCVTSSDCDALQCSGGSCQPVSCADELLNADETDVDCGGTCTPCAPGKRCALFSDCESQICSVATRVCVAPTCADGVRNGGESDIDCGHTCDQRCGLARACLAASDCSSGACIEGHCAPDVVTGEALERTRWSAIASDTFAGTSADNALDGDPLSVWSSGTAQYSGMWFLVDMGEPQVFFDIALAIAPTSVDYCARLRVSASVNGTDFSELRTNIKGSNVLKIHFPVARYARYLKLEALEAGHWWRIDELNVSR